MNPLGRDTALLEILIMLIGSFVLGYWVRWYTSTTLHSQSTAPSQVNKHTPETTRKKDDLKKIEGIGPAIERLLNNNDILTFDTLARKTSTELRAILETAGTQFAQHECESWPRQAELARDGKWAEFEVFVSHIINSRYK